MEGHACAPPKLWCERCTDRAQWPRPRAQGTVQGGLRCCLPGASDSMPQRPQWSGPYQLLHSSFPHLDSRETLSSPGSSSLAAWGPHSLLTALSDDTSITAPVASCREVWLLGCLSHPGPQLVHWGCSCGSKANYIQACGPQPRLRQELVCQLG